MADGEANNSAANGVVELEARGKYSLSWHPCEVSLCPSGRGLIVLHGNNKLEEIIEDIKEILARIRVRSTPLQGDDCVSIKQGEHVLATQTSHVNGIFYDAQVEKVIHVRHSKRISCRCSFTIKWIHHAIPEKAFTVPAIAIMKLATKSVDLHPTISTFFSMQETPDSLDAMPCSMIVDEMNLETDINVLLERQIKAISTSTDVHQENILEDFVPGQKVDLQGQMHGCEIEACWTNGSDNKQPIKLILETPPAPTPSIQEGLTGSKLLLNPLAARAALASLRSEFPQSPELSARCDEKGDINGQHSISNLPQGSTFCSFSAVDHSSDADDISLKLSDTLEGKSPNLRSIAKKLFPTSSLSQVEISNLSSGACLNVMEKKIEIGKKKTSLSAKMRLTRSQIQRDNVMYETSQRTNNNEKQLGSADARRVTQSRVKGAEKAEDKECNSAVRDNVIPEVIKLETFFQSTVAPKHISSDYQNALASPINDQNNTRRVTRSRVKGVEKTEVNEYNAAITDNVYAGCANEGTSSQDTMYCFSNKQKVVASPINGDTSIQSVEDGEGILGKDGKFVDIDTQKVNLIQNTEKPNISKRLTRSSARVDNGNNNELPKLKRRKSDLTEFNVSTEGSDTQTSLTSPRATMINEQFANGGESRKISTRSKTTPKSSESKVGGDDQGTMKSATSKKPEMRSSPRLRCLPRTRSQSKT